LLIQFRIKVFVFILLTYRQTAGNVWCLTKVWECTLRHNEQRHLGQSEDWIFWVSLVTRTCNVWRNKLSRHFVGHRRHFKFCLYVTCNSKQCLPLLLHQSFKLPYTFYDFITWLICARSSVVSNLCKFYLHMWC